MAEQEFKNGDVVYHKVNNLRMVIISTSEYFVDCRYVTASGNFTEMSFYKLELKSETSKGEIIRSQMESK